MKRFPLLLLHGALGTSAQMGPVAELLADDADVHLLDFDGHGTAPWPGGPFSTERFAANVVSYLDEHGIDQADAFGYSMGGYVALYLATIAPERLRRIATLGTKLAWDPATAAREAGRMNPDKILEKVPRFAARLAALHGEDRWPALLRETAAMMKALGDAPALTAEALARIPHPVLVCRGIDDEMVTDDECTMALRAIPRCVQITLLGTPHPIEHTDPATVTEPLEPFFFGDPDEFIGEPLDE